MMTTVAIICCCWLLSISCVSSLVANPIQGSSRIRESATFLSRYDEDGDNYEPYFQMQKIPTATTSSKLDRFVQCAQETSPDGLCDLSEMEEMIEELERLNLECQGTVSRECNLDTVAARNVLKVALASKVAVKAALANKMGEPNRDDCDPYSELYQLSDECTEDGLPRPIPTATSRSNNLDEIIGCADGNQLCDVDEMMAMIAELEQLNMECEGTLSRECNLEAVEARNLLKVALASQVALKAGL